MSQLLGFMILMLEPAQQGGSFTSRLSEEDGNLRRTAETGKKGVYLVGACWGCVYFSVFWGALEP